ncbi:Nucleoid-associated protein [compost metagenome]
MLELTIDPGLTISLAGPEGGAHRKMLEDLVVGAVNVALDRAREIARDEMARVTGGLPFPPGAFGG